MYLQNFRKDRKSFKKFKSANLRICGNYLRTAHFYLIFKWLGSEVETKKEIIILFLHTER